MILLGNHLQSISLHALSQASYAYTYSSCLFFSWDHKHRIQWTSWILWFHRKILQWRLIFFFHAWINQRKKCRTCTHSFYFRTTKKKNPCWNAQGTRFWNKWIKNLHNLSRIFRISIIPSSLHSQGVSACPLHISYSRGLEPVSRISGIDPQTGIWMHSPQIAWGRTRRIVWSLILELLERLYFEQESRMVYSHRVDQWSRYQLLREIYYRSLW